MSAAFARAVDNTPLLLFEDGVFCQPAMRAARVTKATLMETMRGSGAASVRDVAAIVLEATGDITLINKEGFDPELLEGVRRIQ